MNPVWIAFAVGFIIGSSVGVVLMGLLIRAVRISKETDELHNLSKTQGEAI